MARMRRGPWQVLATQTRFETPWIRIDAHEVISPSGNPAQYGTVHFKAHAFGIIPIDDAGRTVIVGQHRFPLDRYCWEIVEGGGRADAPLQSAARELAEETGLRAGSYLELLRADMSNSVTDECATAYVAWDLRQGEASPDETEVLTLRWLTFGELLALALEGQITDCLSLAAIFKLKLLFDAGKLPDALAQRLAQGL